jgi:hypothetical protein
VAAAATVLIVAVVCGVLWLISTIKGKSADSGAKKSDVKLVPLDNLVSPEADAVKAVVDRWIQAGIKGDAEAARKLCTPALANRVGNVQPRKMDYKIRNPIVLAQSAEVVVWAKYPDITDPQNEALLTVTLQRAPAGWQVAGTKTKVYFGD